MTAIDAFFLLDPYPKITPSSATLVHTVSEGQAVGVLLETFDLEAFKFSPKDVKANVKLQIIGGKSCFALYQLILYSKEYCVNQLLQLTRPYHLYHTLNFL